MTRINQDLSDTPSGLGFDPIPAGDYPAHITESDIANTKNGDLMLKLSWTVLEGPHASRILFDNVMLTGSEKAVAFGKRKLRTMADATGHPNPNHVDYSEELHGRPCLLCGTHGRQNGCHRVDDGRRGQRAHQPVPAPVGLGRQLQQHQHRQH